jgi:predicted nucleotidyltransferase
MTTVQGVTAEEQAKLDEATRRLVEQFHPERIYLFGSRARGDWNEDSDYDVMVIVPSSELPRHRRAQACYRALRGLRLPVEVHVWTREEFECYLPVVASLAATINREGVVLYAD